MQDYFAKTEKVNPQKSLSPRISRLNYLSSDPYPVELAEFSLTELDNWANQLVLAAVQTKTVRHNSRGARFNESQVQKHKIKHFKLLITNTWIY